MPSEPTTNGQPRAKSADLGDRIVKGAAWMIFVRWCLRGLGLLSTVILARLLDPSDFGIIAMVLIVYTLLETFANSGVDIFLIRMPSPERKHYDTAWTITVLIGACVAILLVLARPVAVSYFDAPVVADILLVYAAIALFQGFVNIGTVEFRKEIRLGRHVVWLLGTRFTGLIVTIGLAFVLRSYWAVVIGSAVQALARVGLSYLLHSYRPRFSLAAGKEMTDFSLWFVVRSFALYFADRLDQIVLGGVVSAAGLGAYYMASNLAGMVSRELVMPASPVVFSAYAKMIDQHDRLRNNIARLAGASAIVGFPAGAGLILLAQDAVAVLFGPGWEATVPLLQILAILAFPLSVRSLLGPLLINQGRIRLVTFILWAEVIVLAGSFMLVLGEGDMAAIAWARVTTISVLSLVILVLSVAPYPGLLGTVATNLSRPALATVAMSAAVYGSLEFWTLSPVMSLLVNGFVGAACFFAVLALLWLVAGRPDGAEKELIDRSKLYGRRLRTRLRGRTA